MRARAAAPSSHSKPESSTWSARPARPPERTARFNLPGPEARPASRVPGDGGAGIDLGRVSFSGGAHTATPCSGCGSSAAHAPRAKLTTSAPGDRFEQDADRAAEQVTSSAGPAGGMPGVAAGGSGVPLPMSARQYFEPRLGCDFSAVRLHSDDRAADRAASLGARAFTLGSDISFGAGELAPGTTPGRALLAHELAHVAQQQSSPAAPSLQLKAGDPPIPARR